MMKRLHKKHPKTKKKSTSPKSLPVACYLPELHRKCGDLFELTNDLIQIFKPDGTIIEVNPSWQKALEYPEEDLAHITAFNTIHPKDKEESQAIFQAVIKDGKTRKFFAVLLTKTGREIIAEGTVSLLSAPRGQALLFGLFRDVTRRKEYENLKDEFISTVSHELRTPLTVVREGVAQVHDGLFGKITEDQEKILEMVIQNSDRLSRIIEELLDVSKLEAGQVRLHRSLYNVVEVVEEVIEDFKSIVHQKGLSLWTECAKEKIEIYIDREKIVQVLNNLINNSLKFTTRGSIKILVRELEGFVECTVADTGKGISPKDLPKVFDKFSQFERDVGPGDRGAGLGLPICKKLIELHHGRLKIESSASNGTEVSFFLPKHAPQDFFRAAIEEAVNKCQKQGQSLSVILFDLVDFNSLKKNLGLKRTERIVLRMEQLINKSLRRVGDIAIKNTKAILVLLPDTDKENAYTAMGRLSQILEDYLKRERKKPKIEIRSSVACFPQEADGLETILQKIYG